MSGERVLVIGGNAAGMTAASRAKRLDPSLNVTVLDAGRYVAYSICGVPYFLAGLVPKLSELQLFTPDRLMNERGIEARTSCRAVEISASRRDVRTVDSITGAPAAFRFDRLLVATGYRPKRPEIEGLDGPDVFTASRLDDAEEMEKKLASGSCSRAVIVGGGYVGLELADALLSRGLEVTLVEASSQVMSALDPDMATSVSQELERGGVRVLTGRRVRRIARTASGGVEAVEVGPGSLRLPADLVFVDVGVEPSVELARSSGIALGASGAIAVDAHLETNLPGIFAAGNCAETRHLVSGAPTSFPLGTVAAKQGRVAGENLAGGRSRFAGAIGTSIVKVLGVMAARTGLNRTEAAAAGYQTVESVIDGRFRASYFDPGAKARVKVLACRSSGRLLGAQIVGSEEGAVSIDVAATAITAGMSVADASQLDLGYAPPAGALWHPLLIALNTLAREL